MSLPLAEEDAAWARMDLPLTPEEVRGFLANIELVLRINPCIEFERLLLMPSGFLRIAGRNDSNNQDFDTAAQFVTDEIGMDLVLRYDSGIKRETRFAVVPGPHGSVLAITEVYDTPPSDERKRRLLEVDRSLVPWAAGLRKHLLHRERWQWIPGYKWFMQCFWLGMPPRQRRLVRLIAWTTLLEFVVFLVVLAAYLAS